MTRLRVSRLGRDPSHRKHMFRTMVTQLFKHERIRTTLPKKCGFRKYDKAPMAYIELVDSPKEIGKRIEKRPKVYPTIEELREKAPTMDIYNKPVVHVSENKRTSLLGGMVTLLNRLRTIPIPTVADLASNLISPPDLSPEFANVPGPGQPKEKEYEALVEKNVQEIRKNAQDVLARRRVERREERARLRKMLGMEGSRKQRKAAAAAKAEAAKGEGEGKAEEGKKVETSSEANEKVKGKGQQQQAKPQQQHNQAKQHQQHQAKPQAKHQAKPQAKPQGSQQQHNKNKNKNKKQSKKK